MIEDIILAKLIDLTRQNLIPWGVGTARGGYVAQYQGHSFSVCHSSLHMGSNWVDMDCSKLVKSIMSYQMRVERSRKEESLSAIAQTLGVT